MKFCKNLFRVVELSDPEWGPYWMNYKFLKKKINDIVLEQGGTKGRIEEESERRDPHQLTKSASEVEFFRVLKYELKKTSDFFAMSEQLYKIRHKRVLESHQLLKDNESQSGEGRFDRNSWTRLLSSCVKFYKDVLLLENYAIMNYCGFSKILKKHDKLTGYTTREAYLKNVLNAQNFTHFPFVMELLRQVEKLFDDIQSMQNAIPIHREEKLFIEAIRGLNHEAQKLQAEEISNPGPAVDQAEAEVVQALGEEPTEYSNSAIHEKLNAKKLIANPMVNMENSDLSINSSLFPRTNSSDRERDSSFCSEEDLNFDGKRQKTDVNSALDDATIAVLKASDRLQNLAPSPNLSYTMNWMTAIQSKTNYA